MKQYKHIVTGACLCLLVFALFGGTIRHHFNSDDYLAIHHALGDPTDSPAEVFMEFARPSWGLYYRPIIKFFFDALARACGLGAGGYHLASLICYAILCLEVYILALLLSEKWSLAVGAAAIFLTSGAHGEALFWISSLNGVVENVLTLAALIFFILWRQKSEGKYYVLSLAVFVSALLTKESAIALPIILILYDLLLGEEAPWKDRAIRTAKSCWPFAVAGLAFIFVRSVVMRQVNLPPPLVAFEWRTLLAGPWYSIVMTLSPLDWSRVLQWFDAVAGSRAMLYLIIAVVLSALTIVPLALRRFRIAFLVLWMMTAAAPLFALGLVPSERHVVISSAGAAILLSFAFFGLSDRMVRKNRRASIALGFMLAAAFAVTSLVTLKRTQEAWRHASDVANGIIEQTVAYYPHPAEDTTFFFMNVPDSVDGAFVFRFDNMRPALRLRYGNESIDAVRIVTLDNIPLGESTGWQTTYFGIAAAGGNIHVPRESIEEPDQSSRWRRLDELGIVGRSFRYIDNWERYGSSPFLVYSRGELKSLPPGDLKAVVDDLYTLR